MEKLRIACLGDSLTEGSVSYDWVSKLSKEMATQAEFWNFGVNGELAYNAAQRIDAVIACKPDMVFILLGTNDAIAATSEANTRRAVQEKGVPQRPDKTYFVEQLGGIIKRLKETLESKIILITLPPFGDDLAHASNDLVTAYNQEIHQLARAFGCSLLDLAAPMLRFLREHAGTKPVPFRTDRRIMVLTLARLPAVVEDWNAIAAKNGLLMTSDTIHLNTTSGTMLVDLVKNYLQTQ